MKKTIKKLLMILLLGLVSFSIISCQNNSGNGGVTPDPTPNPNDKENEDDGTYKYQGTLTLAPYTVYNSDDTEFGVYETMFDGIRAAGENSTSKNKMYVKDANNLLIFQRQKKTDYWCYDGLYFVGSKPSTEALEWGETRSKCYIVDGQGTGYVMLGASYYENSDRNQEIPLELTSGAYNYMFTKGGENNAGVWTTLGYGYMECYLRLSEATYTPTEDTGTWNAYIFINGSGGNYTSDLGLIGVIRDGKVVWALVRNCSHPDHNATGNNFTVLGWDPVTTMEYDEQLGAYAGADDLYFQCWQGVNGWILKITNLRTNRVYTINEQHNSMFKEHEQYFRFLLAASYCPVVMNVWNARSGASLRNVLWDNVKIARYNSSDIYTEDMYEDFYPGTDNMLYGFSQGADCASMITGVYESDGDTYKAGDKFISYSCYYDGGSHYHEADK